MRFSAGCTNRVGCQLCDCSQFVINGGRDVLHEMAQTGVSPDHQMLRVKIVPRHREPDAVISVRHHAGFQLRDRMVVADATCLA